MAAPFAVGFYYEEAGVAFVEADNAEAAEALVIARLDRGGTAELEDSKCNHRDFATVDVEVVNA